MTWCGQFIGCANVLSDRMPHSHKESVCTRQNLSPLVGAMGPRGPELCCGPSVVSRLLADLTREVPNVVHCFCRTILELFSIILCYFLGPGPAFWNAGSLPNLFFTKGVRMRGLGLRMGPSCSQWRIGAQSKPHVITSKNK